MMFVSIPPRQLLLIDDSAPFRQTLARLLRVAGHTVLEAETASAGLALLRQNPVDLVLTDREMPGLSGWDVARLVKVTNPRLPVVLMTGGAAGSGAPDSRTLAPVDAILWKPFPFTELLAVMGRLMKHGASAYVDEATDVPMADTGTTSNLSKYQPGAPVGPGIATGQSYRRMRRSVAANGR